MMSAERHPCCRCCPTDDPEWHRENPPNTHDTSCTICDRDVDALRAERDAALATLARIQAVATDVDQWGGHSGPSLARHILNIIGGEA